MFCKNFSHTFQDIALTMFG